MSGKSIDVTDTPIVHKAFQWDGTLEDARALYKWITEQNEFRAFSFIFVAYPCLESKEPILEFVDKDRFPDYSNRMSPQMWMVYNTRDGSFSIHSDRNFHKIYEEKTDAT
jgi:hypothetical protein